MASSSTLFSPKIFPKKLISDIMEELSRVQVSLPVSIGQVVLPDVLGTGVDIIATRSLA